LNFEWPIWKNESIYFTLAIGFMFIGAWMTWSALYEQILHQFTTYMSKREVNIYVVGVNQDLLCVSGADERANSHKDKVFNAKRKFQNLTRPRIVILHSKFLEPIENTWTTLWSSMVRGDSKKYMSYFASCLVCWFFFGYNFCILTPNDLRFVGKLLMTIIHFA